MTNPATHRIVTAARRHFFAHGFRSVTMDDLAEELGMSKKTLYASFPSKEALLRAVLLDKFRSVEMDLDGIASWFVNRCLEALHRLLACMQHHTEEIQPPFVRDIRREAPEMFQLVESGVGTLSKVISARFLMKDEGQGIFRKDISSAIDD